MVYPETSVTWCLMAMALWRGHHDVRVPVVRLEVMHLLMVCRGGVEVLGVHSRNVLKMMGQVLMSNRPAGDKPHQGCG